MKYISDFWLLGIAAVFFIISAITNNLAAIMFNTSIALILFWIGLICFILYHFMSDKKVISIIVIVAAIGLVTIIGVTSLAHRDLFNFLGWIAIIMEIGNVLIKTW